MGAREDARRAWRERVARAAAEWQAVAVPCGRTSRCRCIFRRLARLEAMMREEPGLSPPDDHPATVAVMAMRTATSAPKQWSRPRDGADVGQTECLVTDMMHPVMCPRCRDRLRARRRAKRRGR